MCGIVGLMSVSKSCEIDRDLLNRMNETLFHRGPVEGGLYVEPGLGFGHRRLSIIDLESGQQPLFNEDKSVVVVFNGEIYNFQALMQELQSFGHQFESHCDTEVIVHAWEQWGEDCVLHFRGMFAFAIWDRNKQSLFLARDRLGIKPLFYTLLPNGMFAFGSELKALMCMPELSREIDPRSVEDYFAYGYVPEPRTIFSSTFKLAPGHQILIQAGDTTVLQKKYWDVPFKVQANVAEEQIEEELVVRLRDAVKSHMIADVPLGGFLSGGVDSSAVVAMMAGLSDHPVNTCSISFDDPKFDESVFATQVANQYRTSHHTEVVNKDDYGLVDTLAKLYDEPYADSSAIPTYRVCQLARKRVTVALSGDGGDENFAGYRRYRHAEVTDRVRGFLPAPLRQSVFGLLGKYYPKADWAPRVFRAKTSFQALATDLTTSYFEGVAIMPERIRSRIFSTTFRTQLQSYQAVEVMRSHAANSPTDDPLSMVQYLDMKTYLPGDILTKVDRASMAHALEVRVPLLDHQFVEWASSLPSAIKLREGEGKYILKKSLQNYLSDDILYRPKMGFSIPVASWLRGPLRARVRETVLGPTMASTGFFDMGYLRELVDQHQSGRSDYSAPLWSLLMFEAFLRNSLEAAPTH